MISWTGFSQRVNKLVQNAFATSDTHPDRIARHLIENLPKRPTLKNDRTEFLEFLEDRNIREVVHFTRLENVPGISKFGLIPRAHLELIAVQLALSPFFNDKQRRDNSPQANCLSFTSPNYKMFYQKRREVGSRIQWAVLSLDAVLVADFYCEFTARNAASYGVEAQPGVPGARKLFSDAALREQLRLAPNQPTNPQAEILEDTVIPPQMLKGIYVNDHDSREWLIRRGIEADIRSEFFGPRHDYRYWQKN